MHKNFMKAYATASLFVLIMLAAFLCFFNLSKNPIQVWDEATNVLVVNESINPFDFKLRNEQFFEKPPVWYWGTMGAVEIFGANNTSYRVLSAIAGVGITIIVYLLAKENWGHWTGIIAGFSVLSVGHLFINNVSGYFSTHTLRSADLDALQIFFIMLGILFYLKSKSSNHSNVNRSLMFLFTAFAVMTKGPIGFLPITILLFSHPNISFLTKGDKGTLLKKIWTIIQTHHIIPFSILLIATIPWHIGMYIKFGNDFIDKYFFYHMITRATETIEEHKESFLFYIRMFWNVNVFAIGIPTVIGLISTVKNKIWKYDIVVKISVLGILIPLTLFTLIPTKLAWYNLYIYPFAALITGWLFMQKWKSESLNLIKNVTIISLIAVGIVQNISWVLSL